MARMTLYYAGVNKPLGFRRLAAWLKPCPDDIPSLYSNCENALLFDSCRSLYEVLVCGVAGGIRVHAEGVDRVGRGLGNQ